MLCPLCHHMVCDNHTSSMYFVKSLLATHQLLTAYQILVCHIVLFGVVSSITSQTLLGFCTTPCKRFHTYGLGQRQVTVRDRVTVTGSDHVHAVAKKIEETPVNVHSMYPLVDIYCVLSSDYFVRHGFLLCFLLCCWHFQPVQIEVYNSHHTQVNSSTQNYCHLNTSTENIGVKYT